MTTDAGRSLKRFEDPRLLAGMGTFVDDIKLPHMAHAAVVRSPHAHALIRSIDVSVANSFPNVLAVLTGKDIDGVLDDLPLRPMFSAEGVKAFNAPQHPILAKERVCYVGQPVAVVVAEDAAGAMDAAELVAVDYEPLPPVLDPFLSLEQGAAPIHPHLGTNLGMHLLYQGGDVDAAFAQADHVVEQRYHVQRLAPAPMENRGVAAQYQSQEDLLVVWDSTQEPHPTWRQLAQLLKRPESKIRLLAPDVGGGFGAKGCMYPEEVLVPYLSLTLGRPVKWVEDRQENMLSIHARGHVVDVEAAVRRDGTILGMRIRITVDLGAFFFSASSAVPMLSGQRITGPYKTPSMIVEVLGAITNKPPTGPYRGAGGPESAFCMERTVDLIARDLDLDPVEVRKRNFIEPHQFPYRTPTGLTYDSGEYEQGLDRVLELADYTGWKARARQRRPGDPLLGVGLATVVKASGGGGEMMVESAKLEVDPEGRVTVYTGVSPHGQGTETAFAQIVARELGVSPAQVQVLHSDTSVFPLGHGTAASRGTVTGGAALFEVVKEARGKLAQIGSHLLGCPVEQVAFEEGRVYNRANPSQSLDFAQVAAAAYSEEQLPPGTNAGLEFSGTFTLPNTPFAYAAHVVVVEVDQDTGNVKIVRYAAVHDCGRILNPLLVEGQMHGGIVQGIGQALTEGMVYTEDGQPATGSLMDYALPMAAQVPDMLLDTMETPSPTNPLGAKGIGELPTVAAPVAVANAVMDALSSAGGRPIDTPLTPEKIWRALHGPA